MSVSVVIPTYNSSDTIERTLRSVLDQTKKPKEIIIVDDASVDFTELSTIVLQMQQEGGIPIVILQNSKNMNGAASRNRGIDAARSRFVAFLDADDEWAPDKLQVSCDALLGNQNRCFVYSKVEVIQNNEMIQLRPEYGIGRFEHISEYLFLSGGFIQTSSIVSSRDTAKEIRFNPYYRRHQDYDFCLRAAAAGIEPLFIDKPLVRYHVASSFFSKRIESSTYSSNWASEMRPYMSRHGYYGFRFFLVTARLLAQGARFSAVSNALGSAVLLGPFGLWKARHKIRRAATALLKANIRS